MKNEKKSPYLKLIIINKINQIQGIFLQLIHNQ